MTPKCPKQSRLVWFKIQFGSSPDSPYSKHLKYEPPSFRILALFGIRTFGAIWKFGFRTFGFRTFRFRTFTVFLLKFVFFVAGIRHWNRPNNAATGQSVTLYERHPHTAEHAASPIADSFALVSFHFLIAVSNP